MAGVYEAAGLERAEETYRRSGLDHLGDDQLVATVTTRLAVPRFDPADSFVLHAPLELTARAALLPLVATEGRERARTRLVALAARFEGSGPPVRPPEAARFRSLAEAGTRLVHAIERGDLDDVDVAARWLGGRASPRQLRLALAEVVLPKLAAAAHAPILLHHLPRAASTGAPVGDLLRGVARELAREPTWRLGWLCAPRPALAATGEELFAALAGVSADGPVGDTRIHPLMSRVDRGGLAAEVLAPLVGGGDVRARGRALLRVAAWSMLTEPADHAPYGWTHCLTLPQAALGLVDPVRDPSLALAVAATHVVGFRSAMAAGPLVPSPPRAEPGLPLSEALARSAGAAAGAVWNAGGQAADEVVAELATRASLHHDAHLVKYVLACLEAAADDPRHRRLHLAAAAHLVGWWAEHDAPLAPTASRG